MLLKALLPKGSGHIVPYVATKLPGDLIDTALVLIDQGGFAVLVGV